MKEKLLEYVNAIDSGHKKLMSEPTLYAYVCKIGVRIENAKERSLEIITKGCELADMIDGPRAGTLLSYDQILSVILNSSSK